MSENNLRKTFRKSKDFINTVSLDRINDYKPTTIFTRFVKKMIYCSDQTKQLNFIKMYPYFKSDVHIVNIWMQIYSELTGDSNSGIYSTYRQKLYDDIENKKSNVVRFILLLYKFDNVNYEDCIPKIIILMKNAKEITSNINILETLRYNKIKNRSDENIPQILKENIPELTSLTVKQIAFEITRYSIKYYNKVTPHELIYATFDSLSKEKEKYYPNITKLINYFNLISYWIPTEILKLRNPKQQSALYNKFIEIANICYHSPLLNFHIVFALVSGLKNIAITRLHFMKTEKIDNKNLDILEKFISGDKGYSNCRQFMDTLKEPYIPFFGILIADVKHMLECDYYITNKINKNLYEQIIKYTDTYLYNENKNTIALIKCPNVKSYLKNLQVFDSDKLYQMSVAIQPTLFSGKRSASSPNIQVKLPLMKSQTNLNKNDNLCESVKSLKKLLNTPHKKWTNKDVVY